MPRISAEGFGPLGFVAMGIFCIVFAYLVWLFGNETEAATTMGYTIGIIGVVLIVVGIVLGFLRDSGFGSVEVKW